MIPPSTTVDTLDHNVFLVQTHLIEKMYQSLSFGNQLIEEEMKGLSIFLKPIVKTFYATVVQKDIERNTKKLINGILKMAKSMVSDNVLEGTPEFYRRLDEKFPSYLRVDQTGRQCKQSHPNFSRLEKNLHTTFEAQILAILPLLRVKDLVRDYYQLCRSAFNTAEACKKIVHLQTDAMRIGQNIIQEDLNILDIPAARELIFRVLRRGFDRKVIEFDHDIDRIFNHFSTP